MIEARQWVARAHDPFDRNVTTHVTASAIVIDDAGRVLVHRHKRLHRWLQPGGHVDAGETASQAAVRESREETGIDTHHPRVRPCLVHVDAHPGPLGHRHLDLRYLLVPAAAAVRDAPAAHETDDVAWWTVTELRARTDDSLVRAVDAALRRR